jgi:hypothetical protein
MEIEEGVKRAIYAVWDQIGPDALEFVRSNEEAVEMTIDASRLEMFGYPEAGDTVRDMVLNYGYTAVLKRLSREVRLV